MGRQADDTDEDIAPYSKFTSLKTLRWGSVNNGTELQALMNILKASAASLGSLSVACFPEPPLDDTEPLDHGFCLNLTELQMPIGGLGCHIINTLISSRKIRRFRLAQSYRGSEVADMAHLFDNLIELQFDYTEKIPRQIEDMIFAHWETLKILSFCASPFASRSADLIDTKMLLELGRKCINLVELAIFQRLDAAIQVLIYSEGGLALGRQPLIKFPLRVFRNLELLFIAIPHMNNEDVLVDRLWKGDARDQRRVIRLLLEEMLDERQDNEYTTAVAPLRPSKKLDIVAMGLGTPSASDRRKTPRLWKVLHAHESSEPTTLDPVSFEDVIDNDDENDPGWKLLPRYPHLIQNQGLRNVFRRPYIPPSSQLL
ncbi:hypothetical protein TWF718_007370 [Orbilia javanica]|uniref:Uncharacterized protein n=1 Tax=Orbilia javanica TaxID=47235 RepID=A0AAN8MPA8_9PEZI